MPLKTVMAAKDRSRTFALAARHGLAPRRAWPPQTPAPWRWAMTGVMLGAMATLLLCAPAQWLAQGVAWATHDQLLLQEARGTLWQGSAQVVLAGGAGSRDAQALPGRIAWTLQPLNTAELLSLQSDCCMTAPMHLRASRTGYGVQLHLSDTPSHWPAALLSGLGAPWNTLQPQGDLVLTPERLSLQWLSGQWRVEGSLKLTARDMASRLSTLKPMGTYQVDMTTAASPSGALDVTLRTVSGGLLLSGQGQWSGQRLRFQGEASAAPEHEAALDNLLSIMGRRQGARSLLSWG